MIENSGHELERYKSLPYVEDADRLRSHDYTPINNRLFRFLDYMQALFEKETAG